MELTFLDCQFCPVSFSRTALLPLRMCLGADLGSVRKWGSGSAQRLSHLPGTSRLGHEEPGCCVPPELEV